MHCTRSPIMKSLFSLVLLILLSTLCASQTSTAAAPTVPRLVRFTGAVNSANGTPRTGVVGVMFSLYTEQQGGTALWTELQNVTLDANGQYTVLLGSQHSEGVPAELFTTNEARWLGIQVEAEPEQARVLLVSVPYALKAGDAETLGGKPVSAFLLNPAAENGSATGTAATGTSTKSSTSTAGVTPSSVNTGTSGGTANFVTKWIDASTLGNSSIVDIGNIGIGTTTPLNPLHVNGVIRIGDNTNTALPSTPLDVGIRIGPSNGSENAGIDLFNSSFGSGYGWLINSPDRLGGNTPLAFKFRQNSGTWSELVTFRADTQRVGIGTVNPQSNLHVNGAIRVGDETNTGLPSTPLNVGMRIGPTYGSEYSGMELFNSSFGSGYGWLINAPDRLAGNTPLVFKYRSNSGIWSDLVTFRSDTQRVGIGTNAPTSTLSVVGTVESTSGGFKFPDASVQTSAGVSSVSASAGINGNVASGVLTLTGDTAYLQRRISGTCAAGSAVSIVNSDGSVGCQTVGSGGGSVVPPLILSANVVGGGTDPTKLSTIYGANTAVGVLNPDPSSNFPPAGIVGHASNAAATGFTIGVVGRTDAPVGAGVLAMATGDGTQSDRATALTAFTTSATGRTKAIEATVNSSNSTVLSLKGPSGTTLLDANIGTLTGGSNGPSMFHLDTTSANFSVNSFNVVGQSGPTSVQIYGGTQVNGNLSVTGTLSKASGSFKIDHPLDPANKYLYHSFVESPDMMNVYNGVIVLDAHGQAWVQLPDYFEALNQDFRYQLTAIGAPGPNLYVAKEVSGNRFRIAGGKPHAKVSWGTYLHPELFGHDASVAKIGAAAPSSPAATAGENK
jgi:hypothetical protein